MISTDVTTIKLHYDMAVPMTDSDPLYTGAANLAGASTHRVQARVVRKGEPPLVVLRWCLQQPRV